MCQDCGCETANAEVAAPASASPRSDARGRVVLLEQAILYKNDEIARANRRWFAANHVVTLNLMSSPGAGKTALLERTIRERNDALRFATLVGDQQTSHDAVRLHSAGGLAKQITTHSACHLDASMIEQELGSFVTSAIDYLFIENVGNLVCPAAFDLGENVRVALLSLPEGEDKPIKYPVLFNRADLVVFTKVDLAPHLDWNRKLCTNYVRRVNPSAPIIAISTRSGEGLAAWYQFLEGLLPCA